MSAKGESSGDDLVQPADYHEEIAKLKRVAALRRRFVDAAFKYFLYGERGPDVAVAFETLMPDSNPDWIQSQLAKKDPHEPEFRVFRFFQDREETILDIGANWGYSACSILASGSKARILSFEPNPTHRNALNKLRELRGDTFDFLPIGLGSAAAQLTFVVPVIDGNPLSALASANFDKTIAWVAQENFVTYAFENCKDVPDPSLLFAECAWSVERLDDALRRKRTVSSDKIVAIKIDVEGHEAAVLDGARSTLEVHRPLILLEGANRDPGVRAVLEPLGYVFADFDGDACVRDNRLSMKTNGFFLHSSKLDQYSKIGLLVPGETERRPMEVAAGGRKLDL